MWILLLACTGETPDPPDRIDVDEDGWVADEDCDDEDASVHPDAEEVCDGVDQNCNGQVDEGVKQTIYQDADGDGHGDAAYAMGGCGDEEGWTTNADDCDDSDLTVYPGAPESCDGEDQDCDGEIDEGAVDGVTSYADADSDGYGDPYTSTVGCDIPEGYTPDRQDCDDTDATVYPGAEEICEDGVTNDCKADDAKVRSQCSLYGEVELATAEADYGPVAAFVGDHDGDGVEDIAHVGPGGLELLLDPLGDGTSSSIGGDWLRIVGVGDSNGDGLDEFLASRDGEVSWVSQGLASQLRTDTGVAVLGSAGDLDGGGKQDFVVGYPEGSSAYTDAGDLYLYLGPLTGAPVLSGTLTGSAEGDLAGSSLGNADLDGDGVTDLVAGAPGSDLQGTDSGAVFVLHGPVSASASLGDWDGLLLGEAAGDLAGTSLDATDADGDGYGDLLVGAPGWGGGYGSAWISYGPFSGMEGLAGRATSMRGVAEDSALGGAVALVDLDGDGRSDNVVAGSGGVWTAYAKLEFAVWTTDEAEIFFTDDDAASALGTALDGGNLVGDATEDLLLSGDGGSWLVQGAGR